MRLACVQANVTYADPNTNARKAVETLERLKGDGVEFAVFPEAFLTGYCVDSRAEAERIAINRDDAALSLIRDAANRLDISVVVGYAVADDGELYNEVALMEPGVRDRYYRKSHLPELGYDKFVVAGDELAVFDTRHGRIGLLICFDLRPPEAARVLALKGAELIILPTNWPNGAQVSAEHVSIARASENRVFIATCDRVGTENGFSFIGLSKIIAPNGKVLAEAGSDEEIIVADIDLAEARIKRNVVIPGKYEMTVFDSRRPELYGVLSEAKVVAAR